LLRPGVVWFGESIDAEVLERSFEAVRCDVFLTVGTSAVVYPAAGLAREARNQGAFTAEINPEVTPSSSAVDLVIQRRAEEALPAVELLLQPDAPPWWSQPSEPRA
jgi:NAD-dependent deacetylase